MLVSITLLLAIGRAAGVDSFLGRHGGRVGLRGYARCAVRAAIVDKVAGIKRRRLTVVVTRIPTAFVHIAVKDAIVYAEVVEVGRLHAADQIEIASVGHALKFGRQVL